MTTPKRIQRRRTAGWRLPEGAVYVGRGSRWGNPFRVGMPTAEEPDGASLEWCLESYRAWVQFSITCDGWKWIEPLAGKDLACWCRPGDPCHADVLLELANPEGQR